MGKSSYSLLSHTELARATRLPYSPIHQFTPQVEFFKTVKLARKNPPTQ